MVLPWVQTVVGDGGSGGDGLFSVVVVVGWILA